MKTKSTKAGNGVDPIERARVERVGKLLAQVLTELRWRRSCANFIRCRSGSCSDFFRAQFGHGCAKGRPRAAFERRGGLRVRGG